MRRIALIGVVVFVAACKQAAPPGLLQEYQSRSLMTCCNIHYETDEVNDANYFGFDQELCKTGQRSGCHWKYIALYRMASEKTRIWIK